MSSAKFGILQARKSTSHVSLRFRAITNAYYRGAVGAFVCYDVTRQGTFESTQRWLTEIRQYGDPNIVVTLVGNKIDLAEQRVGAFINYIVGENRRSGPVLRAEQSWPHRDFGAEQP